MSLVNWSGGEKFGKPRCVHFDYASVDSGYVQWRNLLYNHSL